MPTELKSNFLCYMRGMEKVDLVALTKAVLDCRPREVTTEDDIPYIPSDDEGTYTPPSRFNVRREDVSQDTEA